MPLHRFMVGHFTGVLWTLVGMFLANMSGVQPGKLLKCSCPCVLQKRKLTLKLSCLIFPAPHSVIMQRLPRPPNECLTTTNVMVSERHAPLNSEKVC